MTAIDDHIKRGNLDTIHADTITNDSNDAKDTSKITNDAKDTNGIPTPTSTIDEDNLCEICYANPSYYTCPDCKIKTCRSCLEQYILEYSNLEPHCMKCMTKLSFDTIYKIFGAKSFDKYLNKAAEVRFALEEQKIPECMDCCAVISEVKRIQERIPGNHVKLLSTFFDSIRNGIRHRDETHTQEFTDFILELVFKVINYCDDKDLTDSKQDVAKLSHIIEAMVSYTFNSDQMAYVMKRFNEFIIDKYNVDVKFLSVIAAQKHSSLSEKDIIKKYAERAINKSLGKDTNRFKYMFRCSKEGCNGFVNDRFECELCRTKYCEKCFAPLKSDKVIEIHECNAEDLLTAHEILTSTKPCPKCASRIFKISGCSQMFCTNCHISFDYNTGKIITGHFHNPHRTEWLLANGGNIEETAICEEVTYLNDPYLMFRLYQSNHIRAMLRKFQQKERNGEVDLFTNRCKYVLNKINKVEYIMYLRRFEIEKYKRDMLTSIYQEYLDTAALIFASAKYKDSTTRGLFNTEIDLRRTWEFLSKNGLLNMAKTLLESGMSRHDFYNGMADYLSYKRDSGTQIYPPERGTITETIARAFDNKEVVLKMNTFENELNLINELVEHVNLMLANYKKVFKVNRVSQLTPIGSNTYVVSK